MCRDYGWTLDYCDQVDRSRVAFMRSVRVIWAKADEYNRKFERASQSFQQASELVRGGQ